MTKLLEEEVIQEKEKNILWANEKKKLCKTKENVIKLIQFAL